MRLSSAQRSLLAQVAAADSLEIPPEHVDSAAAAALVQAGLLRRVQRWRRDCCTYVLSGDGFRALNADSDDRPAAAMRMRESPAMPHRF